MKTVLLRLGARLLGKFVRESKHICSLSDSTTDVQRGILKYLAEHPLAKDTVEGIVQWWLSDMVQPPGAMDVQHALDTLVVQGWLAVTKRSPSNTLYGLEESRRGEVQEFLSS